MQENARHVVIVNASSEDAAKYARLLRSGMDGEVEVSAADDVEHGLVLCQSGDPHCIVLVHEPPDVDGLVFLTGLKFADPSLPPPIVMIAGDGSAGVALEALKRGVDDYLCRSEVTADRLARAVHNAVEKSALRRELSEARAEVARLAFYDPTTGLASRRLFSDRMEHAVELAARINANVCLLMLDVDGLKAIHHELGRTARDKAMREVGRRLSSVVRKADTIACLGGDEFALLMETGSTADGAATVAEKILAALEAPIELDGRSFAVGVSIGISMLTGEGGDMVVRRADSAMSQAKSSGGGYRMFAADRGAGAGEKKRRRRSAR